MRKCEKKEEKKKRYAKRINSGEYIILILELAKFRNTTKRRRISGGYFHELDGFLNQF
jgi:hypothetical protein